MSIHSTYKMDPDKETKGVPVEQVENDDGTIPVFYIAHAARSNDAWAKAYEKATRKFQTQIRLKTITTKQWQAIGLEVFLESILTGWQNVQDENGEQIPFSKDNARDLLEKLPLLYADLEEVSNKMELFRKTEIEASAGN